MNAFPIAATLVSIQVGLPWNYGTDEAVDTHDQPWRSGIYKSSVQGPVYVATTNVRGDGQADLKHHGGVDKAVLAYSADHYPEWRERLSLPDMPHGGFGENLTIEGWSEDTVCIGDIFRIGEVLFEVSQPRRPCWKLARRWRMHELLGMVVRNGWAGWYLRVKEEGSIEAGMPVELIDRPNPDWTIARANQILHHCPTDLELAVALAEVPKLSDAWVRELRERADRLRAAALSS